MKISNTRRIAEKIMQIIHMKQASSTVNMIITNGINMNSIIPSDIDKLRREAAELKMKVSKQVESRLSVDQIMMLLLVEGMIGPYLGDEPEMMDFFQLFFKKVFKVHGCRFLRMKYLPWKSQLSGQKVKC